METDLRDIRVVVTRAPSNGDELIQLLQSRGARVRHVPLIRIGPPPRERELQRLVDHVADFDWLVFSSANGVHSFATRRRAPLPRSVRVAAVGTATAAAVKQQLGIEEVLAPDQAVAEALAQALIARAQPDSKMLIVQAADARPVLAATLRAAGMQVSAVAGYSTVNVAPNDLALRIKDCDVVTLASASAVRALATGLGGAQQAALHLRGKLLACIGSVTEHEARTLGLHVELTAPRASFAALVDALCAYFAGQRQ